MRGRRKPLAIVVPFVILAVFIHVFVPVQHVPWRKLNMDAPVGMATGTKISLITLGSDTKCMDMLASADALKFELAEPKHAGDICGWESAAILQTAAGISFRPEEVTGQCPLLVAGYIWLGEVDRLAKKYLGSPLKRVHHAGTYACRRQKGNGSDEWSEHAFANAWDITGFELEDGQMISVLNDWNGPKSREARKKAKFLRKTRKSACGLFHVVLSPDYNAAHKDHLHLDQGPSSYCQ